MENFDLNATFDFIDYDTAFSSLVDFANFSEENLAWRRRAEEQTLLFVAQRNKYESAEYFCELQILEHRFDVSLPWHIRYATLTALVTTVEWAGKFLENHSTRPIPKLEKEKNRTVQIFGIFAEYVKMEIKRDIQELAYLIQIRNCIVHNAGLVDDDRFPEALKEAIFALQGFRLSDVNLIGSAIEIESGEIQIRIARIASWILELFEKCRVGGHINFEKKS